MTTGRCSHCREEALVFRFRMAGVGLRWLDTPCHDRLVNLGMHIVPTTDADPREVDLGVSARRQAPWTGWRTSLRLRRWLATA